MEGKVWMWLALIVFIVVVGPLCTIWALNTLFPVLAIPYTVDTWVATSVLFGVANIGFTNRK